MNAVDIPEDLEALLLQCVESQRLKGIFRDILCVTRADVRCMAQSPLKHIVNPPFRLQWTAIRHSRGATFYAVSPLAWIDGATRN